MINKEQSTVMVYNGEIYNYLDIKKILKRKGHVFITSSDTEVVLHAYSEWGVDCINNFRGMFALGIIDNIKQEIFTILY